MIGFLIAVAGQVPLLWYGPSARPDWAPLFFGLCLLVYQQMDNVDGKQARRTKSSSALGMLFDHGLDTIVCYSQTYATAVVMAVEDPAIIAATYLVVSGGFYSATLLQYYTGYLEYTWYSPPDDGIPTLWLIAIAAYFVGRDFFLQ
jgi:ethanolaminephosphotransferase